jgi:hypothetical protein
MIPMIVFLFLWVYFFSKLKIRTIITREYLAIDFYPLKCFSIKLPLSGIKSISVSKLTSELQFGGLGIRKAKGKTAYITGAPHYVIFNCRDGKTILLSTLKADEMVREIEALIKSSTAR